MTEEAVDSSEFAASQFDPPTKPELYALYQWHIGCLYCEFVSSDSVLSIAFFLFKIHAKSKHWWGPSEKYLNPPDMEAARSERRRYRETMGTWEDVRAMNRMGL